jgi:ubiquinone/menaquinone biosynthesis C-methylase UbiE
VHEAAARGFGRGADDYERARPGYPRGVIELLGRVMPIRPRSRVCDLAAGTGKLTRLLLGTGADIVAIEPVPAMRRKLNVICPDVKVIDGTAEAIPLDDESVDVVTVGQAFHWFSNDQAVAEIARVLRPAGGLALLWNLNDESVPWVRDIERLVFQHGGNERPYASGDPGPVLEASGRFTPMTLETFTNNVAITKDLVVTRVASTSFISALPDDKREACLAEVRDCLETHPDTAGVDRFDYPYLTAVYWCHRR